MNDRSFQRPLRVFEAAAWRPPDFFEACFVGAFFCTASAAFVAGRFFAGTALFGGSAGFDTATVLDFFDVRFVDVLFAADF